MPVLIVVVVVVVLIVLVFVVVVMAVVVFDNVVGLLVGFVASRTVGALSVVRSVATASVVTTSSSLSHQQAKKQKDRKGQRKPHVEGTCLTIQIAILERAASLPVGDGSFSSYSSNW